MLMEKIVKINCILSGDSADKFLEIKKAKGIIQNTEVIRLLVNECHRKLVLEA